MELGKSRLAGEFWRMTQDSRPPRPSQQSQPVEVQYCDGAKFVPYSITGTESAGMFSLIGR